MKSIGRERELQEVLDRLAEAADRTSGRSRPPTHISVSSPGLGGLTTFLEDVRDAVAANALMKAVFIPVRDSRRTEEAFAEAARALAGPGTDADGSIDTLFRLSDEVGDKEGKLAVLIIDAADALTEISAVEELRLQVRSNPLINRLRILVTQIQDREPNLAIVLGWHDDFSENSPAWSAQDVQQRYSPNIALWPDFQQANAWPIYSMILQSHGYRVLGDYPGFCRSGLPVGGVLSSLRNQHATSEIDGKCLLNVLRQHRLVREEEIGDLDEDVLIALCLEDKAINAGVLLERVRARPFQQFVVPEESAYRATEELYRSLGLRPTRVLLSFERRIRRSYDVEHKPELAGDVLKGVASQLSPTNDVSVSQRDGYATCAFQLTNDLLPEGAHAIDVTAFCSVGDELPRELLTEMARTLEPIEKNPALRSSRLVLYVFRDSSHDFQVHLQTRRMLKESCGDDVLTTVTALQSRAELLADVCSMEVGSDNAVGAVYLSRDPLWDAPELRKHARSRVERHFKSLAKLRPPLVSAYFQGDILPRLIRSAYEGLAIDQLRGNSSLEETRNRLAGLERLGAITRKDATYCWAFAEDRFLKELCDAIGSGSSITVVATAMLQSYFFSVEDAPALLKNVQAAYTNELLVLRDDSLQCVEPVKYLVARMQQLVTDAEPTLSEISRHGRGDVADNLKSTIDETVRTHQASIDLAADGIRRVLQLRDEAKKQIQEIEVHWGNLREQIQHVVRSLDVRREGALAAFDTVCEELVAEAGRLLSMPSERRASLERMETVVRQYNDLTEQMRTAVRREEANKALAKDLARSVEGVLGKMTSIANSPRMNVRFAERLKSLREQVEGVQEDLRQVQSSEGSHCLEVQEDLLERSNAAIVAAERCAKQIERELAASVQSPRTVSSRQKSTASPPVTSAEGTGTFAQRQETATRPVVQPQAGQAVPTDHGAPDTQSQLKQAEPTNAVVPAATDTSRSLDVDGPSFGETVPTSQAVDGTDTSPTEVSRNDTASHTDDVGTGSRSDDTASAAGATTPDTSEAAREMPVGPQGEEEEQAEDTLQAPQTRTFTPEQLDDLAALLAKCPEIISVEIV